MQFIFYNLKFLVFWLFHFRDFVAFFYAFLWRKYWWNCFIQAKIRIRKKTSNSEYQKIFCFRFFDKKLYFGDFFEKKISSKTQKKNFFWFFFRKITKIQFFIKKSKTKNFLIFWIWCFFSYSNFCLNKTISSIFPS
jgi:hypothetical protein